MSINDTTPIGYEAYKAGTGISINNHVVDVNISPEDDNVLSLKDNSLYVGSVSPSAVLPMIEVNVNPVQAGVQITATKGSTQVQASTNDQGIAEVEVTHYGTWTLTCTLEGEPYEETTYISQNRIYHVGFSNVSIYGVMWNKSDPSTQLTRLTPLTDPNHICTMAVDSEPTPAIGTVYGYSPFDDIAPWSGMYECNIVDGVETYKYGEVGFSRVNYDTFIYIPEFYYRHIYDGTIHYFYISDKQSTGFEKHPGSNVYVSRYELGSGYVSRSGLSPLTSVGLTNMRTNIHALGNNYYMYDLFTYSALSWLYLIEFSNWDFQSMIAPGYCSGNGPQSSGGTDAMTYHTGAMVKDNTHEVQYRGIENIIANIHTQVDGMLVNPSDMIYICMDRSKFSSSITGDYVEYAPMISANGYITDIAYTESYPWIIIGNKGGGSATTYLADNTSVGSGLRAPAFGGRYGFTTQDGMWYCTYNILSAGSNLISTRIICLKEEGGST